MSYPPKQYQSADFEEIKKIIMRFPLATLISVSAGTPVVSHVPLIYEKGATLGFLVGHLDKFNPHGALLKDGRECTVLFHGPDSYISPSLFTTNQLPTWNYAKVHLTGKAMAITNKDVVKKSLILMTEHLERGPRPYVLEKTDPRMEALVDYIVGFRIEIVDWEGKFKLSQDKTTTHQKTALDAMATSIKLNTEDYLAASAKSIKPAKK